MNPIKVKTLHLFSLHLFDQHGRCGYCFAACSLNIPSCCLKNTTFVGGTTGDNDQITLPQLDTPWCFLRCDLMVQGGENTVILAASWNPRVSHYRQIVTNLYHNGLFLPCGFVSWFIVIAAAGNNAKKEEFKVIKGPPRIEKHMISSNIFQVCFAFAYSKPSTLLPFNFAVIANNMWSYCIPFSLSTVCTCSY